jgi:hypothetical protein
MIHHLYVGHFERDRGAMKLESERAMVRLDLS